MKQTIRLLPKDVINKIAAGEVIERPASVVKEALENSIDAGATQIEISLRAGGLEQIEIRDNGSGMDAENASLAFTQHATSKLERAEDLESIATLGFRGEALASIASVADNTLHTFDGESSPVLVRAKNSEIDIAPGSARKQGTTLSVHGLFNAMPARKKFLRSDKTELRHCIDTVNNAALAHPEIAFKLEHNDREVYKLKPGNLEQRIADLFGLQTGRDLIAVSSETPGIGITGFISHPAATSPRPGQQYVFINKRPVSDKLISKAVRDGFETTIPRDHKPAFFLFYQIEPGAVDVNVHPRKSEVRFSSPGLIFSRTRSAINHSLQSFLHNELQRRLAAGRTEQISSENLSESSVIDKNFLTPEPEFRNVSTPRSNSISQSLNFTREILSPAEVLPLQTEVFTNSLSPGDAVQIFQTYIVTERNGMLLIVDQHAADERIQFERLERSIRQNNPERQVLLLPSELELGAGEATVLQEHLDHLAQLGFDIRPLSGNSYQLHEVPLLLAEADYTATVKEILQELAETSGEPGAAFRKAEERILATMACHGSIRAGQHLQQPEINKLLSDLFSCRLPHSCPHGRPIIWELGRHELEKQFKRRL